MADVLTVVTELGQDLSIEERWVLVDQLGLRHEAYPTKAIAEHHRPSAWFVEREVRLSSPWRVVDE